MKKIRLILNEINIPKEMGLIVKLLVVIKLKMKKSDLETLKCLGSIKQLQIYCTFINTSRKRDNKKNFERHV